MVSKDQICRELALAFAKIALLHPEKLSDEERIPEIPSLNQSAIASFAMYYSSAYDWFFENFETRIGTKVLGHSHTDNNEIL